MTAKPAFFSQAKERLFFFFFLMSSAARATMTDLERTDGKRGGSEPHPSTVFGVGD